MTASGATGDPINVVFDHSIFVTQHYGGVSRYVVEMARALPAFGVSPRIIAPLHVNAYLAQAPRWLSSQHALSPTNASRKASKLLGMIAQRPLAAMHRPAITHESYYSARSFAPRGSKIAIMVHDMIHELRPEAFSKNDPTVARKNASIQRADHIFCNSYSTLKDLTAFHPDVASRCSVTHLGFAEPVAASQLEAPTRHGKPYILYVGGRNGYKNFTALIEIYAASQQLQADFDLLCVGGGSFRENELAKLTALSIADKVQHSSLDDAALQACYRAAAIFVYPSLYEGFGIPPLEAMAADCPVVTMNISSMPEVCGDAAEYAEPDDTGSLATAINRVLYSSGHADMLRNCGRIRLSHFTWEKCAEQTAQAYRSLLS